MALPPRPLVSVIMAAYDAARFVEESLASVSAQTLDDLQVVVADDGSTDDTAARVERAARADPRIRLLRLGRNQGQATALNAALDAACGRWLAIMDADDVASPRRLELQVAALERDPGLVVVGGVVRTFRPGRPEDGETWRYAPGDAEIRVRNLFKSEFISSAITLDREALARHGLRFDPRYRIGNDWDLTSRALRIGRGANVPQTVLRYRLHAAQMTSGMIDHTRSDSAFIRLDTLRWLGVDPSERELRTHLAVSPCNYWAFGAHPYFAAAGAGVERDAARWLAKLRRACARSGRVPLDAFDAYAAEIAASIRGALAAPPVVAAAS